MLDIIKFSINENNEANLLILENLNITEETHKVIQQCYDTVINALMVDNKFTKCYLKEKNDD